MFEDFSKNGETSVDAPLLGKLKDLKFVWDGSSAKTQTNKQTNKQTKRVNNNTFLKQNFMVIIGSEAMNREIG